MKKLIAEHPEEYYNVSRKTCELIAVLTNSRELMKPELYENKETGGINMCKAFEEMRQEGIEIGIQQGTFLTLCTLVQNGALNISDAASHMHISEEDFIEKMNDRILCETPG